MANLFLPYNLTSNKCQKENIKAIARALENEEAVVTFPAAEVSRLGISGIQEAPWQKGAVYFAKKSNAPILPIYVQARNSIFFYLISLLNKRFSSLLLPRELMGKRSKKISLKIGDPIPAKVFTAGILDCRTETRLLKRHLLQAGKGRKGPFKTESTVVHPADPRTLRRELDQAKLLGTTHDGKKIFLVDYSGSPQVMREIGRLREITFRKVGEGTGKKIDLDQYDQIYKHLILWDEQTLDIAGAYRLGVGRDILAAHGTKGFYTSTLFNYSNAFEKYLPHAIELGRSFVQHKYWNSRALDYLWQGIGAFIAHNSEVKYMFGGVSISNSYPEPAKDLIVYFYKKWFGDELALAAAKHRYVLTPKKEAELREVLSGIAYEDDLKKLKAALKQYGYSIPILYKQYAELCDGKGVRFLDFVVDKDFENCVDGLILVETDRITAAKKERYIFKQMNFAHNNGWGDLNRPTMHHNSLVLQSIERL
jgi:putative hemolysin